VDECKPLAMGRAGSVAPATGRRRPHRGRPVQLDPIKPKLKPPGSERLKLKCDVLLSILLQFCFIFAFKFNLRRYTVAAALAAARIFTSPYQVGWCRLTLSNPR